MEVCEREERRPDLAVGDVDRDIEALLEQRLGLLGQVLSRRVVKAAKDLGILEVGDALREDDGRHNCQSRRHSMQKKGQA